MVKWIAHPVVGRVPLVLPELVSERTRWTVPTENFTPAADSANRLVTIAASQDRRTLVVVVDSGATINVAALAGGVKVLAGRDAVERVDPDAVLEQVRQNQ